MIKVYVLQAQGFGDSEDEFVNIGVFANKDTLKEELKQMKKEWRVEGLQNVETRIEKWTLKG